MGLAIGIDLGGTNIYVALVDRQGQILASVERPTPVSAGPGGVLERMIQMAHTLTQAAPAPVMGIGLAIPGLLDRERGRCIYSENLHWEDVEVLAPFRAEFGLPVAMDNDVRVGALGELHFGAGRHFRNFLFTALGTGIGAGIVLDGQLYRGPQGLAGEFGHIPIRPDKGRCACGGKGCLETLASGPAIRRRTLKALKQGRDGGTSALRALATDAIDARAVAQAARGGDPLSSRIWEEVGADLGLGILVYQNLLDPDAVIVGGGVSLAGDLLLEPARRMVAERAIPAIASRVRIVAAELGDEAAAVGAAALVMDFMASNGSEN